MRSVLPALNDGALDAAMAMPSPVCGLRPWRAARLLVAKVPNPAGGVESRRVWAYRISGVAVPADQSRSDAALGGAPAVPSGRSFRANLSSVRQALPLWIYPGGGQAELISNVVFRD